MLLQRFLHASRVADIAFDERQDRVIGDLQAPGADGEPFDRLAVPLREVVVDDNVVPGPKECPDGKTADVAGAAGDQDRAQRDLPIEK
jgi:hypothetical protein